MALTNSQVVSGPKSRPVVRLAPGVTPQWRLSRQALGPVSVAVLGVVEGPPLGLGFRVGVGFGFGCRAVSFAYALTRQLALQETALARARRSDLQARR